MIKLLEWIMNLGVQQTKFFVFIYATLIFFVSYTRGIIAKISEVIAMADAVTRPALSHSGVNVEPFSLMNYFIPLDLGILLFQAWAAFFLTCTTIRMLKSWIPTVA